MSKIVKKEFKPASEPGHCMPTFTLEPVDGEAKEGDSLEIRAKIDAIPAPKVQWRKGNWLSIDDGGRHIVKSDPETGNYSMTIKSARSSDLGKYKVVVMNDYGEVTAFFQVKITAKSTGATDGIKFQLKRTERKSKVKKTQEELEKEIIEILKTADSKDYESICIQHGFYDFRYILHKLKEVKREEIPAPEFEAAKILRGLRNMTINDEGTAVFEIHMEQVNPDRQLRWLKEGELVQVPGEEKRHELRRVGNVYQLIIRNVRPEDAGTYTLEVGKERFTSKLTIKERPIGFESQLKNQKGTVKGRCVFECTVTRRDMKITWLKDKKEIHFGGGLDRIQEVSEGRVHKLIIMELTKEDSAEYTAKLDKLESTATLTVTSAPVRFRSRLVDTEVKEKSTAYFECTVSNRDIEAQWFINGKAVTSTGRYKITHAADKHTMFIEKVVMADNAAKVEVRIGDIISSATLNVNEKPIKVLKKMEDVKCRTGEKAQFTCEIDDADQKNVNWFKDDKEIKVDKSRYEVLHRGGKHTLVVKSIAFEDEGNYTFQVRGVRLGATLTCTNPPAVDNKFLERVRKNPLKFRAGTKARIVIPIIAKEPTQISWTNGRVTLEERGRYHMESAATEAVVEVQSCKISDSGDYELTIVNENGDLTVAIPVKIVDKPNPPSGEIKFFDIEKDSVSMRWEEPIDLRTPVEKYVIEMQVEGSSTWKKVTTVVASQTTYKATNLTTGKKYKFRVKSSNEEGESEPLESDNVTPAAPDQPPKIDQKVIDQLARTPIVVNAGETATIRVPVQGNPSPSATWNHNGEEILPVKHHRAKKESSLKEVTLQITKCNRTDNGDYEARIFNNVGEILVKTKIIVNDVPAFKEGAKVNIDKVSPKEVKISWDAPEDDGNQPITAYEIEKALAGTDSWQKVGETKAGTTSFTAGSCKPEESYVFRVKAKNSRGASQPINSSPVTCGSAVSPPKIDPRLFDELTKTPIKIKAGQTGRLVVPLSGEPVPTATWSKDGDSLEETPAGKPSGASPSGVPVFKDGATIKVDMVTRKEVTMSWEAPMDEGDQPLSGYDIEKSKPGSDEWEKVGETKRGTTSFTASNCTPGETYVFRVKAKNVHGASEPVTSAPVKTNSRPGVPVFKNGATIEVDKITRKEVKMSWEAPVDEGDQPLSGYDIEKSKPGSDEWEKVGETKRGTTNFTASNCTPGETYVFRVKAKNVRGASEPVTSAPVKTNSGPDVPAFNDGATVKVDSVTAKEVRMSWEAPDDDGDRPISGYDIEKCKAGTNKWEKVGETKAKTTSFTASNCAPGETYVFRVKAKNSLGASEPVTSRPVTCGMGPGVPSFKNDATVNFEKVTSKEVKMSWEAPEDDGNQPITAYQIEKSVYGTGKWDKIGETKSGTTSFTASNCTSGETYLFRVKAKNNSGTSEPVTSAPVTCGSKNGVPVFDKDSKIIIDKASPKEVQMSWDRPANDGDQPITGYEIERTKAGTNKWEKVGETEPGTTGFTAGKCAPGETYEFRVKAKNSRGTSEPVTSSPVICKSGTTVPSFKAGATVKVDKVTPKEVKMSWDSPTSDGDQPLEGFDIERAVAGTDKWEKVGETKPGTTGFTASNCAPGETYVFRVKAKNCHGSSKPVTTAPVTTGSENGVPAFSRDAIVKAEDVSPKEVKMSWDAPANEGDRPVTGYEIEKSVAGTDKWEKVGDTKPGTTSFTASNCAPGETYVFRVKAKNARGTSKPVTSAPITCKSITGIPTFKDGSEVMVDNSIPNKVKMTWDAPDKDGYQPISGYDIEKSVAGTDKWEKIGETKPGTTGFTASDCEGGETYVFRVKAKNCRGASEPVTSAPVTCKRKSDVPVFDKDARIIIDKASPKEVQMSWDRPANGGDQPITGYEIERTKAGTNKWEKVGETEPETTDFTASKCAPGETYEFRVKAKNSRGTSEPVTSSPVICKSGTTVPSFKDDATVKVDKVTPKEVKMSWDAPTSDGDQPLAGFDIETALAGTDKWKKVGETKPGTTGFTASNCVPGETYVFRVKAKNCHGSSKPVTTAPVTTGSENGVPAFSRDATVKAEDVSPKEVKMSWNAPANEGDRPVTGYEIEKSVAGTDNWEKVGDTKPGTTSFTASNCAPGETYVFRVKANNARGTSKPVTSAPIICKSGTGIPTFKDDSEVTVDNSIPNKVKMTWDAPAKDGYQPISGYDIEKSVAGTDKWEKIGETKPGTTGFTASDCEGGETYVFRVKAKNCRGASEPVTSAPVTCKRKSDVPVFDKDAKVIIDKASPKEVQMSWDRPADGGDQPITGYEIERTKAGTNKWEKVGETEPEATGFTASKCAPGETYEFRVKAKNRRGTSEPVTSSPVICKSGTTVPSFKDDATVKVDKVTKKEVKMSWDAPTSDGDQPLAGFDIETALAGTDKWKKVGETKPGTTGFTASNCAPGETYVFRVKAKNCHGSSKPVTTSPVTTGSENGVPAFSRDATVKAEDVSPKEVKMSWDAPANEGDRPVTGYEIEKSVAGTDKWEKVGDTKPEATSFTASNCAPGETYVFRVKAKNARGASKPVTSAPIICKSGTGIPTFKDDSEVMVDNSIPNKVKMTWDAPAKDGDQPISGYDIEKSVPGTDKWEKIGETKPDVTDFTPSDCEGGETYVFRVKAKNCRGASEPVTSAPVTCKRKSDVPVFDKDANVIIDKASPEEVQLSWDRPANNGDQPITGYEIERSKAGTDKWQKVGETVPEATGFTASKCAPGETYEFRVKAKNSRGTSEPVTSSPVICKSGTTVPSFKDGATVKVDKVTKKEVKMSWDAPTSDGDQPLAGFDIETALAGTDKWKKVDETKPGTTGFTVSNCAPGETYVFRVKSKNCHGPSKPVTTSPVTTGSENGVPAFSRDATVKAEDVSPKEVKMSWDAPANEGDRPVTGYEIEKSVAGTDKWEKVGDTKPGATSFTASNCAPGETYVFRVKAKNARGASKPVTSAPIICKSGTGIPTFKDDSEVMVDNSIPNKVKMTWDAPAKDGDQPISGYDIEKSVAGTDKWEKIGETKPDATDFTPSDCEGGETYVFRVKAKNCRGASEPVTSAPVTCKRKSDVPVFDKDARVIIDNASPKEVQMSWDRPADGVDQPITGYVIERTKAGTNKWEKVGDTEPEATGFTARNCAPGETYKFRVKAKNSRGTSEPATSSPVICKSGTTVPSFKDDAIVKVDKVTQKEVKMSWDAPTSDGDQPLAGFDIETALAGTDKWKKVGETKPGTTGFTASNCAPGETYVFRARAKNCHGSSKPVKTAPVTTGSENGVPAFSRDATIKAENVSPKEVKMSWDAPANEGDRPVTGYEIEKSVAGTDKWKKVGDTKPGATSFTASNCAPGETCAFRVKAKNARGASKPVTSAPIICKSGTGIPTFKDRSTIKVDNSIPNKVKMTWDAPVKDGDQPMAGYDIEKSVAGTDKWEKIGETKPGTTDFTPSDYADGETYVFRIKAKNCRGASKPVTSAPVTCKRKPAPAAAPGGTTARPAKRDNHRLVKDTSDAANAQLIIHLSERTDSGKYICKLKNEAGELEIPLNVIVMDSPRAPSGEIDFSDISSKGVTVSWKSPTDDGGSNIDYYVIEKKEEGRKNWTSVGETTGSSTTSYKVKGVPSGKNYRFRVRAVNDIGEGQPLESEPVLVKDPYDEPSKIKGDVEFETATDDSISISWPAVENDGGSTILGYHVEKRKKQQSTWGRCNQDELIRDRKYTASGLIFDSEYEFRVIAVNAAGEGIPSNPSQAFVARTPVDAPGEPSDLELIDSTNTSLTLAWKGTEQHGGAELLGYEIEIREERSEHWNLWTDGAIMGTSCVLRGLNENASYHVRMRSINNGARSKYYYYKGVMTATEILMAPSFKMTPELQACVRDGFYINAGSTIRINVPYTGRPKPHIVWLKDGEELDSTIELVSSIGIDQMTIRHARGHHSGIYTICLTNSSGTETLKVPVKVFDVPMPPTGPIRVEYETDRGLTLSWHVSRYDGGKPIQGYVMQSRDARGRDWQTIAQNVHRCEYVVDSLQKSRSYYFRILAENEIGRSEPLECKTVVYIKQEVAKVHIEDVQYHERDLRTPPQITVPMKPRIVPEGVKVTLSCSISGKPPPTIRWFKDNRDISDNSNYFKENVIGLCRLVIKHAKPTDAGVYKVMAENPRGSASCQANLIVET